MRPQQQNRRMRGRNNNNNNNNNNNRKGPNPLTRNYESNGPDVKIRGSAQQIAEKYTTLARDAQSSGDRVMAENYLQHAEHYNRIIAAAQAQMPIQNSQQNRDDFDDDGDDSRDDLDNASNANGDAEAPVQAANHGSGPQPVIEGTPAEVALNNDGNRNGRHRDRRPNGGYGQNGQRGDYGSRGEHGDQRREQGEYRGEQTRGAEAPAENAAAAEQSAVPQVEDLSPAGLAARAEANENAGDNGAPRRARRPRRPRADAAEQAGDNSGDSADAVAAPAEDKAAEPAVTDN